MSIVLFLAIVIVILLIWIYYIYLAHPDYPSYEYNSLKSKFKTGDIILFHALDNVNPIMIGCYYGHIGIVYVDPDNPQRPYLFEAFSPGRVKFCPKECADGIILGDLEHRLNSYRGYTFYKELEKPIPIEIQRGFKEFINYAIKNMKYREDVVSNALDKLLANQNLHNETNCGELVYLSLIKLGLLPPDSLNDNRKLHLHITSSLENVINNSYYEPVYILSNYFKPLLT